MKKFEREVMINLKLINIVIVKKFIIILINIEVLLINNVDIKVDYIEKKD